YDMPSSFNIGARTLLRPFQTFYWISMYEMFGWNDQIFFLVSQLILAGAGVLMGAVLLKAFRRPVLAVVSMLLAFFLPTLSIPTYSIQFDNGRLAMLFFWASVLCYQYWAASTRPVSKIGWLSLGGGLYYVGNLSYESALLFFVLMPLFVLPLIPSPPDPLSHRQERGGMKRQLHILRSLIPMGFSVGLSLVAYQLTRLYFDIQAVNAPELPPFSIIQDYAFAFPEYVLLAFQHLPADDYGWLVLAAVATIGGWIFWQASDLTLDFRPVESQSQRRTEVQQASLVILIGTGMIVLGIFPFMASRYAALVDFYGSSRIYVSASFGAAVLLGLLVDALMTTRLRTPVLLLTALVIGVMAAFHAGLRLRWQEAYAMRQSLTQSLYEQIPEVTPDTVVLYVDFQQRKQGAVVFEGTQSLQEFTRIFYDDASVDGRFLYLRDENFDPSEGRVAVVSADGILARGMWQPVPPERLVIVRRVGDRVEVVDHLTPQDAIAIDWQDGIREITTNPARILPATDPLPLQEHCCE
ncbi:MAG: hypothetical protein K8I82_24405, partial [Anaerolineae bacterium]|nr:hypothetical protein [Anaerolineae bacterium]